MIITSIAPAARAFFNGLRQNVINNKKLTIRGYLSLFTLACLLSVAGYSPAFALTAANGDFEAESITTTSSKNIKLYKDSYASGGKSLIFYVNGTATRTTSTPESTKLTVFARGTQCGVSPLMTVKVDNTAVLTTSVTNTSAHGSYTADVAVNAGNHSVQVAFTNDSSSPCDINLIVDRIEFTPGTIAPTPVPTEPEPTPIPTPEPEPETTPAPPTTPCASTAPLPSNSDPGTLVLADGFESNDFSKWSSVIQNGDATAKVQNSIVKSNSCAALVHVTANTGSRANFAKTLPANSKEIWATGWFNITREGASTASNVPTFRFFNGTTRLLDVSRQNGNGTFFVRWPTATGYSWNSTGKTLNTNQWYQIKVHAVANGAQSQVQVWLDDVKVFDRSNSTTGYASFGSFTTLSSFQVGAEHVVQDGDFAADDVVAKVL